VIGLYSYHPVGPEGRGGDELGASDQNLRCV
jgi:hypothetical protein